MELKQKSFDLYKAMCIKHLKDDLKHLEEAESFDELTKHLYGIYRIFGVHAKTAFDFCEDKAAVRKSLEQLEGAIKVMENGRYGLSG